MTRRARLLAALLALVSGPAAAALDNEAEVLDLLGGLPGQFVVESAEDGDLDRVFRLRSAEPIGRGAAGPLYLRATLTLSSLADAEAAAAEVGQRLAAADPDIGLSYAWDFVAAVGSWVAHLHAECTFSEESFLEPALALARTAADAGPDPPEAFWCRCGGGCRAGVPASLDAGDAPRLPPVRRPAEDAGEEYDNRLDPSGAWTSRIGELSLMHYADGLSFSYTAVFGPTAHVCEGAGVAGLVGTDRYEYVDEQGTLAFVLAETEVRMELVDGIASFCGAGWVGDRFTTDRFEPPGECAVAAERAHFHVEDAVEPERRGAYVVRGDRVEAVSVAFTGDQEWLLGRFVGPQTTTVGLLMRRDLECPASTVDPGH